MREEIRAVLAATEYDAVGKMVTKALVDPIKKLDDVWRYKHRLWVKEFQVLDVYYHAIIGTSLKASQTKMAMRLTDMVDAEELRGLEDAIYDSLNRMPRKYAVHFPMRTGVVLGDSDIKLGEKVTLGMRPFSTHLLSELASLNSITNDTRGFFATEINTVRVDSIGYIEDSADDSGASSALAVLRQFIGMALALHVVKFEYTNSTMGFDKFTAIDKDSERQPMPVDYPLSTASLMKQIVLTSGTLVLHGESNKVVISEEFAPKFALIDAMLTGGPEDGRNIRTAAEWLFDSVAESNETNALLFAAIGLEATLDGHEDASKGQMRDRLAWSLGGSLKLRRKIAEEYSTFYKVRCDVAHGRERQLNETGRAQLMWGQKTLQQIIAKELERGMT